MRCSNFDSPAAARRLSSALGSSHPEDTNRRKTKSKKENTFLLYKRGQLGQFIFNVVEKGLVISKSVYLFCISKEHLQLC